jgi:polysaccharide biosynthesis protein VpsM
MRRITSAFTIFVLSGAVSAATDPQSIAVGGASLIPTLKVEQSHDDNIFSKPSDEKSSTETSLIPRLEYYAEKNEQNYLSVSYDGDYTRYWDSRDDDYEDHTFGVSGAYSRSDMFRLSGDASTARLHDDRGTGASEGVNAETEGSPDEYDKDQAGVMIDIGREQARFGASFSARTIGTEYTNNRDITAFRDRDDMTLDGKIYARVSGKTRLFAGYRTTDFEYDSRTSDGDTLDSDESTGFIGVEWEATGRTTGTIEIGRLDKDFDSPLIGKQDITVWNVGVKWQPRTYSTLSLTAKKNAAETNGTGAFIEQQDTGVSWNHDWSERLHSTVSMTWGDDEYAGSSRQDDREDFMIGLDYDWRRWVNIGLRFQATERDSNDNSFDYDRRQVYLTFDMSL